jgi:hypothetical protein
MIEELRDLRIEGLPIQAKLEIKEQEVMIDSSLVM